jgi:hypothetical protein
VVKFVVDETPYACWDWDLPKKNLDFLDGIDADYFEYVAKANASSLDGEDKHRAALSLRLTYSQGLETLFALLCSAVQAPQCTIGWMLSYKIEELQHLVQKITQGSTVYSRLNIKRITWDSLAECIHCGLRYEQEKVTWIQEGFGTLWLRFAGEFTNTKIMQEYNSAKHGLRTRLGGFSISIGKEQTFGVPPPPEQMQSLGGSTFGTSFFTAQRIIDDQRLNFHPRNLSRNWDPEDLLHALILISMSINNVVSFLRILNGVPGDKCRFLNPRNSDEFDTPWRSRISVTDTAWDTAVSVSDIVPATKSDVLDSYGQSHKDSN